MRFRALTAFATLAAAIVAGGWFVTRGVRPGAAAAVDGGALFESVLSHVESQYVDSLPREELLARAARGVLGELGDPHSALLTRERAAAMTERTTGRYGGVGVQIDVRDGFITVVAALPGTPAAEAGLGTGDRIVELDGRATTELTAEEASRALRGAPGSRVRVLVERPGVAARLPFTMVRREIQTPVVRHAIVLRPGVGYVDLTVFGEAAAREVAHAVDSLHRLGARTVVFDMRGNPGGLLEQGIEVADLFLDPGQRIMSMRGRARGANAAADDRAAQRWPDLRLIVLVDSGSASAAEIVAGALQDHDRAAVIGTHTFGKGSAQSVFPLAGGGALKLTTARWFTPLGRSISRADTADDGDTPLDGGLRPRGDTSAAPPRFRTPAGRTVFGGGGIQPDVVLVDSAATHGDRALAEALGEDIPTYRNALTAYALSLRGRGAITSRDFEVTPELREGFLRELARRGVHLADAVAREGAAAIDRTLGAAIARYVFGEAAEFERGLRRDRAIAEALRLAAVPGDQRALMRAIPAAR